MNGELMDLAVMGVGAGAKGTVTGWLKDFMPGVSEDIAAIVAGGGLYYFGDRIHPLVKKFGAGVLIAGIGQMTKGIIPKLGGGGSTSSSSSHHSSPPPQTLASLAQAEASRSI